MDVNDWAKEVRLDEIPIQYHDIAQAIGVENLLKLSRLIGGQKDRYIPKFDGLIRQTRNRLIIAEYNGYNASELARKYDLTDVHIYDIIRDHRVKKDQCKLWDMVSGDEF